MAIRILFLLLISFSVNAANCIDYKDFATDLDFDEAANKWIDPRRPESHAYRKQSYTIDSSNDDGTVCQPYYTETGDSCDWVYIGVQIQFTRTWVPWNSFQTYRYGKDFTDLESLKDITCGYN